MFKVLIAEVLFPHFSITYSRPCKNGDYSMYVHYQSTSIRERDGLY